MRRPRIVMDTEYTTWEGAQARRWSGPGERREIVQIAALKFDAAGNETDRFERYVKPVFNPVLSDFFVELTGITQKKVDDEGRDFVSVMREFHEFARGLDNWCYGRDDAIIRENAGWFGEDFVMPIFLDARTLVAFAGHDPADWSSGSVHQLVGKPRPGEREHDALDDCRSLALFLEGVSMSLPVADPKRTAA